jgi:aerobic carbon-monoxide dehydrogenase medium subunit
MKGFDYLRPASLEEACAALAGSDGGAKPLAGGTDLVVQMKEAGLRPTLLVSLRDVPGLSFLELADDLTLTIGAATPLAVVEHSPEVRSHYPAIAEAASFIGSAQVRTRATIGGNLCNAAPSADTAPILLAYGARATVTDGRTERTMLLEEFFTGPGQTVLKPGELLKSVSVPPCATGFGKYYKTFRSAMDCCTVGVAAWLDFDPGTAVVRDARVALGAVAPTPIRSKACEETLVGETLDEALIERAAVAATGDALPISDVRASADYRMTLVSVLCKRALDAARVWAQKGAAQ